MRYHNITKCDMLNGKGLRVVLWVSHCTHNCIGCHNPETHDANSGIPFDSEAYNELCEELDKDYISGITFSGGDPMSPINREEILGLIKKIKKKYPKKTIWVYSGYTWEYLKNIDGVCDIDVLVDGPYVNKLRDVSLQYIGSSNQRIIDVKSTILSGNIILEQ